MLFEGALVAIIKEQGGDYGLQKLFGTLGGVIFGPLSGKSFNMYDAEEENEMILAFEKRVKTQNQ